MPGGSAEPGTSLLPPGTPDKSGLGGGMGVGQQAVHDPVAMASHLQQIQYQAETQLRALQMGGTPPGHTPGTPQLPPMMMQGSVGGVSGGVGTVGPSVVNATAGRSDLAAMLMSSSAAVMPGGMMGAGVPGVNAAAARLQYSFPSRPMTAPGREGLTTCLSCDAPILNASRYVMQPGHTLGGGYALWSPQVGGGRFVDGVF